MYVYKGQPNLEDLTNKEEKRIRRILLYVIINKSERNAKVRLKNPNDYEALAIEQRNSEENSITPIRHIRSQIPGLFSCS